MRTPQRSQHNGPSSTIEFHEAYGAAMPELRLSEPEPESESDPFFLWIQRHPWWVGIITVGFMLCFGATMVGMGYLLGTGALTPQSSASTTP